MQINIRASILPTYNDCARRSATRIIPDTIADAGFTLTEDSQGVGAAVGTSVHKGSHTVMNHKIDHGDPCPEKDCIESAVEEFDTIEDIQFDATSPDKDTAQQQIIRISKSYYHLVAPRITPVRAEFELKASLPGESTLSGHPDVLDKEEHIRDTKTGRLRPHQAQVGAYSLLARSNNIKVAGLDIDFLARVSIKKEQPEPQHIPYDVQTCEQEAHGVIRRVQEDVDRFEKTGDKWSFAANPMSNLCSPKYCRAYGTAWCGLTRQA